MTRMAKNCFCLQFW